MSEINIMPGGKASSSGAGTITGVYAGDGLSGGALSGVASLEINHSYSNTFLAPQTVSLTSSSTKGQSVLATGIGSTAFYGFTQDTAGKTADLYSENGTPLYLTKAGSGIGIESAAILSKYVYTDIAAGTGVSIDAFGTSPIRSKEIGSIEFSVSNSATLTWASTISFKTYFDNVEYESLRLAAGYAILRSNAYLNFGSSSGSSGYGIRDNSGTMQYCNSGGTWTNIGTGGGGTYDHAALTSNLDMTTSGHLAATSLAKNLFLASPSSATGTISFRSIASADLPIVPVDKGGTGANTAAMATLNLLPPITASEENYALKVKDGGVEWGPISSVPVSHATLTVLDFDTCGHLAASTETANTVLAGPSTGSPGNPSFRSLVDDDMPVVGVIHGGTSSITTQGARLTLLPAVASHANKVLAVKADESDYELVPQSGGGTNDHTALSNLSFTACGHLAASTETANTFLSGPVSGPAGSPSFRIINSNDVPIIPIEKGGTGEITVGAAINALLPSQIGYSGYALTTNGVKPSWTSLAGYVTLTGAQTITGLKSFDSGIKIKGTSTGYTQINSGLTGSSSETYTLPPAVSAGKYLYCNSGGTLTWESVAATLWTASGTTISNYPTTYSVLVGTSGHSWENSSHLTGENTSSESTRTIGVMGTTYRDITPGSSGTSGATRGVYGIAYPSSTTYKGGSVGVIGYHYQGGYGVVAETKDSSTTSIVSPLAVIRSGFSGASKYTGIDIFSSSAVTLGTTFPEARLYSYSDSTTTGKFGVYLKNDSYSSTLGKLALDISNTDFLISDKTLSLKGTSKGTLVLNAESISLGYTHIYNWPGTLPSTSYILSATSVSGSTVTLGWVSYSSPFEANSLLVGNGTSYYYGETSPSGNILMMVDKNKSFLLGRIPYSTYYNPIGLNWAKFSIYVNAYSTTADTPLNSGSGAGMAFSVANLYSKELFTSTDLFTGIGGMFISYSSNSTYLSTDSDIRHTSAGIAACGERGAFGGAFRTSRPIYSATFDQYASASARGHSSYLDRRAINDLHGPTVFVERLIPIYSAGSASEMANSTWINNNTITSAACTNLGASIDFSVGSGSLTYAPHVNHGWPHGRMTMYWENYNSTNTSLSGTSPSRPAFGFYLFGTQSPSSANSESYVPVPVVRFSASSSSSNENLKVFASSLFGTSLVNILPATTGGYTLVSDNFGSLTCVKYSTVTNNYTFSSGDRVDYYGASDSRAVGFGVSHAYAVGHVVSDSSGYGTYTGAGSVHVIGATTAKYRSTGSSNSSEFCIATTYLGTLDNCISFYRGGSTMTQVFNHGTVTFEMSKMITTSTPLLTVSGILAIPYSMGSTDQTNANIGSIYIDGLYLKVRTSSGWKSVLLS